MISRLPMAEQKNDRQASSRRGRAQPARQKRKSRQKGWRKEKTKAKVFGL